MKIKLFSVRPDEVAAIETYQAAHPELELITCEEDFHDEFVEDLAGFDGFCVEPMDPILDDLSLYQRLADIGLKQVTTRTAGLDAINVEAAKKAGLVVTHVPAYSPRSVAEFALMQIFRLLRHTPDFDKRTASKNFQWISELQSREIHSVTVGIIGAGRIGLTLAEMLKNLGVKVLAYDIKQRVEVTYAAEYVSLDKLLAESDVISIHVDLNPSSIHLLDEAAFSKMKPGMLLVNAARGQAVDTKALFKAIDKGIVAAAALDSFEGEGLYCNHDWSDREIADPLVAEMIAQPEIILTPHIAFYTNIAVENMVQIALDDIVSILKTGQGEHEV